MELLQKTLAALPPRTEGDVPGLMTHIVLGYPSLEESLDVAKTLADAGSCIIELQIPFSDPTADGPTIMEANEVARENDITASDCLKAAKTLTKEAPNCPFLFMSYLNPIYSFKGGLENFFKKAKQANVEGLIIPDIPPENTDLNYWTLASEYDLAAIPFVSPLSNDKRIRQVAKLAETKFTYCLSSTATTGAQKALPKDLFQYLTKVGRKIKSPLAVGFGISKPEHTKALKGYAEIAIVGSATIDIIRKTPKNKRLKEIRSFVTSLLHRK